MCVLGIVATTALQASRQISSLKKLTVPSFYTPATIYQSHMIQTEFKHSTSSPIKPKIQKASHFKRQRAKDMQEESERKKQGVGERQDEFIARFYTSREKNTYI